MADFKIAYAPLAQYEGEWCNDPTDRGGETYAGIARNFFPHWPGWTYIDQTKKQVGTRASALSKALRPITALQDLVLKWYEEEWWNKLGLGSLPQSLANEIFEQAVNLGKGGAGKLVQRMCNAFNYNKATKAPLFSDLTEDGAIGPKTLNALAIILEKRANAEKLVHALNCLQGAHYIGLAARKASQRCFTDGWMTRTHDGG